MSKARRVHQHASSRASSLVVAAVGVLGIAFWLSGYRGVDHPAQAFRVTLFEQHGFTAWNTNWYAGHHTPGYGVVYPALASWVGEPVVAIAATVASVALFFALLRQIPVRTEAQQRSALAAGCGFSAMMLINLWEGRLPFAVGVAFGLASLLLAVRRRWITATAVAVLSSLGSPLAGAFVALVAAAWALATIDLARPLAVIRQRAAWLAVAAVVPVLVLAVLYPQGGFMPFLWQHFVLTIVGAALAVVLLTRSLGAEFESTTLDRVVVVASVLTIASALLFFFVPTPVGGNLARLAILAGPALIALVPSRFGMALGVGLMLWHATPLLGVPAAIDDPARDASFHEPLIEAVEGRVGDRPTRIEIPFTERHWETAHVAPHVPIARGWERQLDHRFNSAILDDDVVEATYIAWLRDTAIQYVAIPAVPLEENSERQAAIVASSDGVTMVWSNDDWRLFEVVDAEPLGTSELFVQSIEPDRVAIEILSPGTHVLKVRYSPTMRFEPGAVCLRESADGWTEIVSAEPMVGQIVAAPLWSVPFGSSCP